MYGNQTEQLRFQDFANFSDCYEGNGSGYRGRKTTTISGRKCQDWGSQSPHKHKYTPER